MISDDPDAAIEALSDAARLSSPEAVETYLALGDLFKREGDLTRAIRLHRNMLHRPGLPGRPPRRGGAGAGRRLPARRDAGGRGRGLPQAHGARGTRWPPPGCATSSSTRSGTPRRSRSTGPAARPTPGCSPTCSRRGAGSFARPTRPARSPRRARRWRPTRGAPTRCWRSPRRSPPAATGRGRWRRSSGRSPRRRRRRCSPGRPWPRSTPGAAALALDRALAARPGDARLLTLRGRSLAAAGRPAEALAPLAGGARRRPRRRGDPGAPRAPPGGGPARSGRAGRPARPHGGGAAAERGTPALQALRGRGGGPELALPPLRDLRRLRLIRTARPGRACRGRRARV